MEVGGEACAAGAGAGVGGGGGGGASTPASEPAHLESERARQRRRQRDGGRAARDADGRGDAWPEREARARSSERVGHDRELGTEVSVVCSKVFALSD
mgnify:CR=1 FL=1